LEDVGTPDTKIIGERGEDTKIFGGLV